MAVGAAAPGGPARPRGGGAARSSRSLVVASERGSYPIGPPPGRYGRALHGDGAEDRVRTTGLDGYTGGMCCLKAILAWPRLVVPHGLLATLVRLDDDPVLLCGCDADRGPC